MNKSKELGSTPEPEFSKAKASETLWKHSSLLNSLHRKGTFL